MNRLISVDDLHAIEDYESVRNEVRRYAVGQRKLRRFALGESLRIQFENRDTLLYRIHEMMRAEGITDQESLRAECDVYSSLLPGDGILSFNMTVLLSTAAHAREALRRFEIIDESTTLVIGRESCVAEYEDVGTGEDRIATVRYGRFVLDDGAREHFGRLDVEARLIVDLPTYHAEAPIEGAARRLLIEDLK